MRRSSLDPSPADAPLSGVLFVVAALLVAGLYIGLSLSLRDQPLSQGGAIRATVPINDGSQTEERTFVDAQAFERQVNREHSATCATSRSARSRRSSSPASRSAG